MSTTRMWTILIDRIARVRASARRRRNRLVLRDDSLDIGNGFQFHHNCSSCVARIVHIVRLRVSSFSAFAAAARSRRAHAAAHAQLTEREGGGGKRSTFHDEPMGRCELSHCLPEALSRDARARFCAIEQSSLYSPGNIDVHRRSNDG